MLLRFFYLDEPGLLSLHAQLNHQELTEFSVSNEDDTSRKSGWNVSLKSILGLSGETTEEAREATSRKFRLRAENLLNEIQASLRAQGLLYTNFKEAGEACRAKEAPVWVSGRYPFYALQFAGQGGFESINRDKSMVFSSTLHDDGYNASDDYFKHGKQGSLQILMSASTQKFPGLQGGYMGMSCHEALFFQRVGAAAFKYQIFGSLFAVAENYQLKPYALSV